MQSQLWDRQSGVRIEPLIFELETEEPNPLAITENPQKMEWIKAWGPWTLEWL